MNHFYDPIRTPLPYKQITGLEHLDKVIEIDQIVDLEVNHRNSLKSRGRD
jgi:excinuclease UvrABC ATPase subunit